VAASATQVKVCGLTRVDDAERAQQLGAWALGMVFADGSPRRCSREQARAISARLRRKAQLCGVFVNAPLEEVIGVSEELGLALLQLHGDEGPAYCAEATRRSGARVIKAAQVSDAGDIRALERFHVDYHLLDARSRAPHARALRGGTGETFDWDLLRVRRTRTPLILSGGLEPGNVAGALAAARPFAVDTASGTEAAPGRKDPAKLAAFFDAVRAAGPAAGERAEPEMVSPPA
jgi:phosphoribosylanthranilate isomerase